MSRGYGVVGQCLNTASATLPIGNLVGGTTVRGALFDLILGCHAAPANNAAQYQVQRGTTAGTWGGSGGAAITPFPFDTLDSAAVCAANQGVCSVGPTLTANAFLLQVPLNQNSTFRFLAQPGFELKLPAATNSLNIMPQAIGGSAFTADFSLSFFE
jgi:hypothetical protein